ncbi:hypothetical protein ACRXCV_05010 [Halobacteriovorax sp. GFR7]|uniref:hypothetical protein n=1 Tax=unclassified Halobacteriovorax TaxID=2639665 RepID=UPI003D97B06B
MKNKIINDFFEKEINVKLTKKDALEFLGEELYGKDSTIFEFKIDGLLKLKEYLPSIMPLPEQVEGTLHTLKTFYIILTLNKYYASKHVREGLKKLPSSIEEFKKEYLQEKLEELDLPVKEMERLEKYIEIPETYAYFFKQKSESKFFKLNRKNKFYYEYQFYVIYRSIFKELMPDNYWKEYISFLKLCHEHIGEIFIKELDFDLLDVKDFQERLRYYEELKDLQLSENIK